MKITDLKNYKVLPGVYSPVSVTQQTQPKKSFGENFVDTALNTGTNITNFLGGKAVADTFGSELAKIGKSQQEKDIISREQPGIKETIGSGIQLGANFLPGAGVGASLATKIAVGAATGLAFDVGSQLQDKDKKISDIHPGIGTLVGGVLPVGGAVIGLGAKIIGRLFKGLGSGLSGVSTKTIDTILENPKVAQEVTNAIAKEGGSKILEKNAKQIINGVSTIRQQARKAFGEGLETLSETDIAPKTFRDSVQKTLDKYGVFIEKGKKVLSGVEFTDPKNIAKASELIDRLSNVKLDGKSLRKLADDIENSAFKVATSDERLSYNVFVKDLSTALKDSISASTPKLSEINKAFSQDMQLVEAVEDIFGKVDYKNLSEVVKASKKLEALFAQKGLAPDVIDNFLKRIGINPSDFKVSEAVRQITDKTTGGNTKGLTFGEIMQQVTSSVITPQLIRDISIKTGIADKALTPLLKSLKGLSPALQKTLIQALLQVQ